MSAWRVRGATLGVCIVSSLLPVAAASCLFDRETGSAGVGQRSGEKPVGRAESGRAKGFVANQFCYACHADFEGEMLVARHEKAGIGCERCHGESERHRSDEANITPPELMYPRERINPTCMMCHPRGSIERFDAHEPILAGAETIFDAEQTSGARVVCTDCHAKGHKMSVREVRWDKATGELLKE